MIDPPIDKLAQISIPEEIEASEKKAISIAADEIMNGDVIPSDQA